MKTFMRGILFFDTTISVLAVTVLSAALFTIGSFMYAGSIERKNRQLDAQLRDLQSRSTEVVQIKAVVQSKEKRIKLAKSAGVVSTLEHILKSLGLDAQALKPLEKARIDEFTEENAELVIQDADLNSIVNLLYKIDLSHVPMKIKSVTIRSTFEDPDRFMLRLAVSLLSKG